MIINPSNYSILIPFKGRQNDLRICLESISSTVPIEVEILLIISKSSTRYSWLDRNIKVVKSKKDLTYPEAINLGAHQASGEFLIFCDSDTYMTPNWFNGLVSFYHETEHIGIASSKLINPYSGKIIDFGIGFTKYNCPHIARDQPYDHPLFKENRKVQAACSANMIIKKELFFQLDGMNKELSYSYCDLDLCLRMKTLGYETWVVGNAVVYHRGASSDLYSKTYKGDIKSRFWAINQDKITTDMDKYYGESFDFFKSNNKVNSSYFLIDISTILDYEWHYTVFTNNLGLNLTDIYKVPPTDRDLGHISLYELLSWNVVKLRFPIIYFIDRIVAISNNALWWHIRSSESDIVIDRNGNMDSAKNLVQ